VQLRHWQARVDKEWATEKVGYLLLDLGKEEGLRTPGVLKKKRDGAKSPKILDSKKGIKRGRVI